MTAPLSPPRPPIASGRPGHDERVPPAPGEYEWVYLWQRPLRFMHWVAALCIVVLAATGLFIGRPYFVPSGDPSSAYLMGWVRFTHFIAAAVLVMTGIVRVYWLFMGNRFERIGALFPLRPRDLKHMVGTVKFYLMIRPEQAPRYLGHNPLQQLSYTGLYVITVVMVVTGFAMYGTSNPGGWIYNAFHWVNVLLGGQQIVRFIHHVLTWPFLIFIPMHVYLALRADALERTGTISSIVSGGRFVPSGEEYVDGRP